MSGLKDRDGEEADGGGGGEERGRRIGLSNVAKGWMAYVGVCATLFVVFGPEMGVVGSFIMGVALIVLIQMRQWAGERRKTSARDMTEEEFEAEWESRDRLRKDIIDIASEVYDQVPVGKWQMRHVTYPQRGWPKVHEEHFLEMVAGGSGTYRFIQHDLGQRAETAFRFKPAERGKVLIQLTAPKIDEWVEITFGFSVGKNFAGEEQLRLSFEGESPLGEEQEIHWPFGGIFVREEEMEDGTASSKLDEGIDG